MTVLRSTSKRFVPTHAVPACLGLALATFAMSQAHADTGASAEPDIRFTGALVTGSPPLPKNMFNIEPYLINTQVRGQYDEHGNRHDVDGVPDSWTLAVPMAYGFTDKLTVGATLTAGYASEQSDGRKWEMGDTTVSAQYLLATGEKHNSALAASIKQNFTTGRYDELDRHNLAEATGSGAPTTQLTLAGQMYLLQNRNLRARFNVGWRLPGADASIDGESAYGTPAGFRGRADLHAASQASVSFEYSFNPQWVAAADLVYEQDRGAHVRGSVPGADGGRIAYDEELPFSWRLSVAPAVEYNFTDSVGLIAGAQVSFDGRNSSAFFAPQVALNMAF